MEMKRLLKLTGIGTVIVILAIFGIMGFVMYDVMSYTATDYQKLNPAESAVGKALVVYDPGISGQAKNAAEVIAKDLQGKGYTVNLVGINSAEAKNTSDYNIIIVGGPIYAAKASKSVESYLSTLKTDNDAKIAAFATGQDADVLNNNDLLIKEVAPLPTGSTLKITAVTKIVDMNSVNQQCAIFVDSILK